MRTIKKIQLFLLVGMMCICLSACSDDLGYEKSKTKESVSNTTSIVESEITEATIDDELELQDEVEEEPISLENIPEYSGEPYVEINNNTPFFDSKDLAEKSYESYSELDQLGRCGVAIASIGQDIMPTEERGEIGNVKPTGWHTVKYNDLIDGNYLYNRCHLIAYELSGENANEENLITGTRYMNVEGMLPFENLVADFVKKTDLQVLYRVTPIYEDDNLVASGVLIEAKSVEDSGKGICFNVYCYNVQPGIEIDYATGESKANEEALPSVETDTQTESNSITYILNKNTRKFHNLDCTSVEEMKEKNRETFTGNRDEIIEKGYVPCKRCNP